MNPFLKKALFSRGSPYFSILPWNLNWFGKKDDSLVSFAQLGGPIVCVDVGCRGGAPDELYPLRRAVSLIGFEADAQECDRLNSEAHPYVNRTIFPIFVSGGAQKVDFHLYKSRPHSSSRSPGQRFAALFADSSFHIEKSLEMRSESLDCFFDSQPGLAPPDFLKIDTQGTEFEILEGARRTLQTCSMVEVEVEFLETYSGQKLFHEVAALLLDSGFDLFYLNRIFSQRRGYVGRSKGQMTFGDALFVRREDCLSNYSEKQLLRFAALLVNYGYLDFANQLASDKRISDANRQKLLDLIRAKNGRWFVQCLQKRVNPWIDRLILLLLHLRRDNGLRFDSDRSWPVR